MLRQDHLRSKSCPVRTIAALPDSIKPIAWRHNPSVGWRPLQILAEIFEYGWRFRRKGGKVVDGLVNSGGKTCGRDIMPEDAPVHHLPKERRLRDEFPHQVGNVFLTLR